MACDNLNYSTRLHTLGLFRIRGRLVWADLMNCWKACHCSESTGLSSTVTLAPRVGSREHCCKLLVPSGSSELRYRFFNVRSVAVWNNLHPNEAESPSSQVFKSGLFASLSELLFSLYLRTWSGVFSRISEWLPCSRCQTLMYYF